MKREYQTGQHDEVTLFTGIEVEHTPAYGKKTLFVTGWVSIFEIEKYCWKEQIEHIFFGANHSFNPETTDDWAGWTDIISHFLNNDYLCSLDIPISLAEDFLECSLIKHDNFIPQLRVPVPYIKKWNYNAKKINKESSFVFISIIGWKAGINI